MKKILFLILAMLLPIVANAGGDIGFAVGGINYEPLGGYGYTATVKGLTSDNSSSRIFIPASVAHNGDLYAVKAISSDAFRNNTNLVSVYISDGIKSIGASSFAGCINLKCVRLPETLETIMAPGYSGQLGAFEGCTALKSIYLPESLNYQGEVDATAPHNICRWAFKNCTNLKTVVIAAQYPYIEDEAFINCSSLNYLVSNVTELWNLESNTFQGIPTTASLIVPDGLKSNYEATTGWNSFKNIYEHSSYTTVFAIVTAGQGGKVALDSEDVSFGTQVWGITKGQNASFTITPDEGQKLKKLLKDGQDVTSSVSNGKYTVSNVQSDFTLEEGVPSQSEDKGTAKLSIESFDIKAGETKTMMIDMQNPEDQVTLVQFDLRLPSGLSIASGDDAIDIAGRTTWKKHTLATNAVDGITRFLLYSSTNAVIEGTSGAIISVKLVASSSFNGGDIKLENQLLTTPSLVESKPATYTYNIKGSDNPPANATLEMTCKVLNAVDGIVYDSQIAIKMTWKNISEQEFKRYVGYKVHKQLENGEWINNWRGSSSAVKLQPGQSTLTCSRYSYPKYEDGFYKVEWGYDDENDNWVSMGSTIIEVRGHDHYRAIWMDSDVDNGSMKTFCDEDNLDFSNIEGLKAYIATEYNASTSEVKMQQVNDAAAGTGLLLVGQSGCYLAERVTSASTYPSNMLVGVMGESKTIYPHEDGYTNYIYNQWYSDRFQKFIIVWDSGNKISYEAYLRILSETAGDTQTITPNLGDQDYYSRCIVMEEATGTWCGWCVRGIETIARLQSEYPDNFIGIGLHYGDDMDDVQNYSALTSKFTGYPSCFINRNSAEPLSVDYNSARQDVEQLKDKAIAKINVKASYTDGSKTKVSVNTETTFGFTSNTADYRIAYVVVEDEVGPYSQKNYYSGKTYDPSHYMYEWTKRDAVVDVVFNDVARAIYDDTYGVNGSVPSSVTRGETYSFGYDLTLPTNIDNVNNIRIITLLLDNETGEIVNASQCNVTDKETGISVLSADGQTFDVFSLSGAMIKKDATSLDALPKGVYIVNGRKVVVK